MKYYVGITLGGARREVFKAENTPTETEYSHKYFATIGPFKTKRGAQFMATYGNGNPHCLCVNDAEYLAKKYEVDRELKIHSLKTS